jgi:hypothetical protein
MKQLKSVRVRPINASVDERLGNQKFSTNLSGSISDVKITITEIEPNDYSNTQLGIQPGTLYIAEWLPISDLRGLVKKSYNSEELEKLKLKAVEPPATDQSNQISIKYLGDSATILPSVASDEGWSYINVKKTGGGYKIFKIEDPNFNSQKVSIIRFFKPNTDVSDLSNLYAAGCSGGISTNYSQECQISETNDGNFQIQIDYYPNAPTNYTGKLVLNSNTYGGAIQPQVASTTTQTNTVTSAQSLSIADSLIERLILDVSDTYRSTKGIKNKDDIYQIIQNPWNDDPPKKRNFGTDPYYLNNGAKINIFWMIGDKFSAPQSPDYVQNLYKSFGFDISKPWLTTQGPEILQSTTFSQIIGSESDKIQKGTWIGGINWSNEKGEELDPGKNPSLFSQGTFSSKYYLEGGIWKNPESGKLERYPIDKINKYIVITSPKTGENGTKKEEWISVKDVNISDFGYIKPISSTISIIQNSSDFYQIYVLGKSVGSSASGLTPSGLTPSGLTPSTPSGLTPSGLTPSGLTPSGLTPSGLSFSVEPEDKNLKRLAEIPKVNSDLDLIGAVIDSWKRKVPNYNNLRLCEPSFFPTLEMQYISPINPGTGGDGTFLDNLKDPTEVKFPLVVQLTTPIDAKAKKDIPQFKVFANRIPETDPDNIFTDEIENPVQDDDEYVENVYAGETEEIQNLLIHVELEAPKYLPEVPAGTSNISSNGSSQVNDTSNFTPGTGVKIPTGPSAYSHNEAQGYNLVDSKWYGDILTSALYHIDHPTFDVPGTEKGALGCASWVSMVFYRAFGVHMRDGKPVKKKPTQIGDFGSAGTGELGGWFAQNSAMWERIDFRQGQPGDIVNTERASKAGHVGVVMNQKNKDGSWTVASNSSKGFGSKADPQGCGKLNYSIKTWEADCYKRNPGGTFCWRYKGPKLQPGQSG